MDGWQETFLAAWEWPFDTLMRLFVRECGAVNAGGSDRYKCQRPMTHRGRHYWSFEGGIASFYDRWEAAR